MASSDLSSCWTIFKLEVLLLPLQSACAICISKLRRNHVLNVDKSLFSDISNCFAVWIHQYFIISERSISWKREIELFVDIWYISISYPTYCPFKRDPSYPEWSVNDISTLTWHLTSPRFFCSDASPRGVNAGQVSFCATFTISFQSLQLSTERRD